MVKTQADQGAELGLLELVDLLWSRRFVLVGGGVLAGCIALGIAFMVPKRYEAFVRMLPAAESNGGGQLGELAGVASQLGGTFGLGALSLNGAAQAKQEAIATLESDALTSKFIESRNLLPALFPKRWDSANQRWMPDVRKPTPWEAVQLFSSRIRTVTESTKTGIITLRISTTDPQRSSVWANDLVAMTNEYLREKAIAETARNIEYLGAQARATSAVGVQSAIYSVFESEIKKQMIAKGRAEYALRVVDPASTPERAASPRIMAWAFAAACLGMLMMAGTLIISHSLRKFSALKRAERPR